jgi:hypothetical protein
MTTWPDVILALSGAPVGAAIAVIGVRLTNKNNAATQQEMLRSQESQQRERLDFELKAEHLRESLRQRSDLYVTLLILSDEASTLASYAIAPDIYEAPLTNSDVEPLQERVKALRYRVDVHCSASVREAMSNFDQAVQAVNETVGDETWHHLRDASEALREWVIKAAVEDRTSGLTADGLGGR